MVTVPTPSVAWEMISSMPEIVGKGGLPADPENLEEIRDRFRILYDDLDLRENLSKEALKRSLDFSWRKTVIDTLKVYEKIILMDK